MRSFWRIFWLEWTGLARSRTIALLLVASVLWMFFAPSLFGGDGTPDGARAMALKYSLGGVAALVAVSLTAAATGSLARERAAKRLQLTLVRPVGRFALVVAKIAALASVAALVLSVASVLAALRGGPFRPCRHVFRPVLVSPAEEAAQVYESYRNDPETPEEERKLPKTELLRLLAQRATERYQPIATNGAAVWRFPSGAFADRPSLLRLRVTNEWHLRDDARLAARLGDRVAAVTNLTRTVSEYPFVPSDGMRAAASTVGAAAAAARTDATLTLANVGARSILLRPRRDVEVLVEADGFHANLVRATLELLALVTALIAFGVFLGSALARPVALFTAFVTIALSEMSPSVLESVSGELAEGASERIALTLTRFAAAATRPVSALAPLEKLSADECVEADETAGAVATDLILLPCALALLTSLVLRRKTGGED